MKKGRGCVAILSGIAGVVLGIATVRTKNKKQVSQSSEYANKHLEMVKLYGEWLRIRQEGKSIVDYLLKHNMKSVAIYGMSYLGESLLNELKDSEITVKYGIDKNADAIVSVVDVVTPEDLLEPVDTIIVTSVYYFDAIEEMLRAKTDIRILSLEDIIYSL